MNPDVSVILCSYNQARFFADAIDSVLKQTHPSVELVIVDNGSTDGSADIARRYASDPRVRLFLHEQNGYVTKRLNEAIAASRGRFLSILYSDDYYLPHKLETQLRAFEGPAKDAGIVYGPGLRLNVATGEQWQDPSNTASGWVARDLFLNHTAGGVNPITPLVRRECYEQFPFDESVFIEGEFVYLRMSTRYRFHYLDEPLAVMRDHESNVGRSIRRNVESLMLVLDAFERSGQVPPELLGAVRTFRARILRNAGWQGVRVLADPKWARSCYRRAVSVDWSQAIHPRSVAGMMLSGLPAPAIRLLNTVADRARARRGHGNYVESLEGRL